MKKISRFLWWKLRKLFDVEILIEINFIRIFWRCIYFYNCVFSLNSSENLQFFECLRRNSYIWRSSKIFQNSEESSSSVYFPNLKILRLRLRSIFNLRCNTGLLTYFLKSKTLSVIPFHRAFLMHLRVTRSKDQLSSHF